MDIECNGRKLAGRRLSALVLGIALLGLGGCDEPDYCASQTVLWRLERGGQVSWLMGTIHAPHPRFQPLPAEVTRALHASPRFFAEMDLGEASQLAMLRAMRLPDGESLRDRIGQERFARLQQVCGQLGLPVSATYLDGLRIWAAALVLSQPRGISGPPLDLILWQSALQAGGTVVGLETAEEQAGAFDVLDDELQTLLLEDAMTSAEAGHPDYHRLVEAYLAQDIPALVKEVSASLDGAVPEPRRERFAEALLTRRNHRFRERLLPMMDASPCFIAVGAAHLLGPEGMLALLAQDGFDITPAPFRFPEHQPGAGSSFRGILPLRP